MLNDKFMNQFIDNMGRFVVCLFVLQRSDAWTDHGFCRAQENEHGTGKMIFYPVATALRPGRAKPRHASLGRAIAAGIMGCRDSPVGVSEGGQ